MFVIASGGWVEPRTSTSTSSLALIAVVVLVGVAQALRLSWTCDDAFISYRYAENLVNGLGLVYNAGEHVEGYTNFLWTMLIALGLKLGFEPERWSIGWGIAFYAGTIVLLGWRSIARGRLAGLSQAIPVAAIAAVVHEDWSAHATSGLETSMFVFLVLAGFLLTVKCVGRPKGLVMAGATFGLAALTRPDGALFGVLTGAWLLSQHRNRWSSALGFGAAFLIVVAPFLLWRHSYYGDWVPNTFYAKSADLPWVSQGSIYAQLYFLKYGVLLAGPVLVGLVAILAARARPGFVTGVDATWRSEALLAPLLAVAHTAYVIRVGGDFMYARMLLPATPLLFVLLEMCIVACCGRRPVAALASGLAIAWAIVLAPHPLPDRREISGIVNERLHYPKARCEAARRKGQTLRPYFEGLPVRVAFMGAEARVVYYSKVPVAIECSSGLTDRTIARTPLRKRGRVGHEKRSSVAYLLEVRDVQLALEPRFAELFGYTDSMFTLPVTFGGASCSLLRWDPGLVTALKNRGARVSDFPRMYGELLASEGVGAITPLQWERLRRFAPTVFQPADALTHEARAPAGSF